MTIIDVIEKSEQNKLHNHFCETEVQPDIHHKQNMYKGEIQVFILWYQQEPQY